MGKMYPVVTPLKATVWVSLSRSSVPHFWHPSWSWWTISLNSTIHRPSTIQSSLSSGLVVLLKCIKLLKLAAFLVNFPSLVRNIFYFFCGQSQIEVRQNHHGGKNKRLFSTPCTRFTFCVPLAPSEKRTQYCVQPRTGWVIFSLFCFVALVLIAEMKG